MSGKRIYLLATDDPQLNATGWTWSVNINRRDIRFSAPSGGVVDLASFITAPAVDATKYASVVQIVADYITANPPDVEQAVADYLTANPPATAPDATTAAKGLIRLAGDLAGTADAPTVPGLADKADTDHTHTLDDVTDYSPPDLSGYATNAALTSGLSGKADDGHGHDISDVSGLQTALDGKQPAGSYAPANHDHDGVYAPALGADDNYVTDAEKAALHTHPAVIAQGATAAAARTAIGAGTSNFTGAYADLSGKPTLGTAAATDSTDYATAAQGAKADSALQIATPQPINAQTGAYTLTASDAGKLVQMTLTVAADLTVPASVFTAGQRVDLSDRGTARVTVVAGPGMTVNPPPGGTLVMEGRYAYASLVFVSATEADLVGLVAGA